jgi:hypothetical protein
MKILKRIIAITLSIIVGSIFIYSGYTKLFPVIETFEFTFVELGIANWYTAPFIARLFLGLEFFVGCLLILNYQLKKITIPITIILLSFFTIYLIIQIFVSGNNGNCGCFGEHLKMTPLQAIIKNAIMFGLLFIVYFIYEGWKIKYNSLLLSFVGVTLILTPFIINPIDYNYTSNNLDEKVNYPLALNLLFQPEDSSKVEIPKVDIRKGNHVVAFLSLKCPHCKIAAKKFRLIKKNNPQISIYFILNGQKSDYSNFIEETKADNIPYSFCLGKTFVKLASFRLPRIYYLDNGIVLRKVDYLELNQYEIEEWYNKKINN